MANDILVLFYSHTGALKQMAHAVEHRIKLQSDWSAERMGIAIFVERPDPGEVLEATARYPLCSS